MCNEDWISQEFSNISLGDKRLNVRALSIARDFASKPGFSANKACDDWSSTKAAYRFFNNDKVKPEKILSPHISHTIKRSKELPFVLAIQDSSGVNFTEHPSKKDMGKIGVGDPRSTSKSAMGLYLHPTLAVSPSGLPIGILNNFFWKRGTESEDKESIRWLTSIEEINERSKQELNILSVADRESDFNEFFICHKEIGQHFLSRSKANRKIMESESRLHEYIKKEKTMLSFEQEVQNKKGRNNRKVKKAQKGRFKSKDGRTTRKAQLNLQYSQVTLINNPKG